MPEWLYSWEAIAALVVCAIIIAVVRLRHRALMRERSAQADKLRNLRQG